MSLDVYLECNHCGGSLFSANVTHNLNSMAGAAGIYEAVWRPEEVGITRASQLPPLLRPAIERMRKYPDLFEGLNPANGWGSYDDLVEWLEEYADACEKYPDAAVRASR